MTDSKPWKTHLPARMKPEDRRRRQKAWDPKVVKSRKAKLLSIRTKRAGAKALEPLYEKIADLDYRFCYYCGGAAVSAYPFPPQRLVAAVGLDQARESAGGMFKVPECADCHGRTINWKEPSLRARCQRLEALLRKLHGAALTQKVKAGHSFDDHEQRSFDRIKHLRRRLDEFWFD